VNEAVAALAFDGFSPRAVRSYIEESFSSDGMAQKYIDLYRRETGNDESMKESDHLMEAA
jgi:hypothetical protein